MANRNSAPTRPHITAVLQALLVTFLWSSSMILIKVGLKTGLPALTFAGLRYSLAFVSLIVLVLFNPTHRRTLNSIPPALWLQLSLLGVLFYTITQGANFIGLSLLPANSLSLIFNFAPLFIALASGFLTKEKPSITQWIGVFLSIAGVLVYFLPFEGIKGQPLGYFAAMIAMLAYSASSLLGRQVNLQSGLSPIVITTISMGIGGLFLLIVGGAAQGIGQLDITQWLIIGWLAIINTAFAFTLWNNTLRTLTAVEASIINNTILPQVAILAWLFLDESLKARQIVAMLFAMMGVIIVQLRRASLGDDK